MPGLNGSEDLLNTEVGRQKDCEIVGGQNPKRKYSICWAPTFQTSRQKASI